MKDLRTIAEKINLAANNYEMGEFQEIRREIRGLSRIKDRNIFTAQTVHERWAFHSGGRNELQFNIGFDHWENEELFRYGIAFSLEPSRTLPKPLVLKPKILKLSQYFNRNVADFEDLRFWYECNDTEKKIMLPIGVIPEDVIRVGTFLFWGKQCPRKSVRADDVLRLFDRLLKLYYNVEGNGKFGKRQAEVPKGPEFKAGCSIKQETAFAHSKETTKEIALRHNKLQEALHTILCVKYGESNVGAENGTTWGGRIDLIVRDGADSTFYEIKTSPCIRTCLREAVAQLMEYSYWPGGKLAKRLVVVSENHLTQDANHFIMTLRTDFGLPIYYQRIDIATRRLEELM